MGSANEEIIFANRPAGAPDSSTFKLQPCAVPAPKDGEVLVRATNFSVDPYMRGRLSEAKSYAAGWELGTVGMGGVTGVVVESKAPTSWLSLASVSMPELIYSLGRL